MCILVVDDDTLIAEVASRTLRASRYQVECVMSAEAALRWMQHRRPRLLVLDAKMPGMDGFALLKHVKNDPVLCDVPVVMLTASRSTTDVLQARALGASGYVVKPFTAQTLLRRVQLCLEPSASARTMPAESSDAVQNRVTAQDDNWLV